MAGTLYGLGMSQRVDSNGKPAVGWLLYIFGANSSTPVDTFQDFALTVKNTWPITADAAGMMPPFWVPDGAYRARATSNDASITYFDLQSITAVGPSSGAAPPPGVDPSTIFQTGDVIWLDVQGVRTGWVRDNGRTIGSATSGATERANADCLALFTYLWNNFSNTICPVVGGRGASASADWTANKQITLPDKRGYSPAGVDDMGNAAAGRWSGAPIVSGTVTTAGALIGETTHATSQTEMPSHTHVISGGAHVHAGGQADPTTGQGFQEDAGGGNLVGPHGNMTQGTGYWGKAAANTASATPSMTAANTGGGGAHNNVQLTVLGTFYRKL